MHIRPEQYADKSRIATLIARTYLEFGAGMIQRTGELRRLEHADADLALVAEVDGIVVAFLMMTPIVTECGNKAAYVSVFALDNRLEGFDVAALLKEAESRVQSKGYDHLILHARLPDFEPLGFVLCDDAKLTIDTGVDEGGDEDDLSGLDFLTKPLSAKAFTGCIQLPEILR